MLHIVTGFEAKQRKCAILEGQRSGNNRKKIDDTIIEFQNEAIPVYGKDGAYRYFGFDTNVSNTAEMTQVRSIVNEFRETINNISECSLPNSAKVQAINIMCMSKLSFYFPNISFPENVLKELEDIIVDQIRTWFDLNSSTTRSFIFTSKACFVLGIPRPHALYYATRLSFILNVLNSDDLSVRKIARNSLALHMTKRKVPYAQPGENNVTVFLKIN